MGSRASVAADGAPDASPLVEWLKRGLWSHAAWVLILALLLTYCGTIG